jgi:tRNA(Ile)-lysidine synthase
MLLPLQIFKEFINKHALLDYSARVLLAVSGGKDSVAMTHLFHKAGFKIAIAHCNFNLRAEESVRDEHFVRNLAEELQVPFHLASFDTNAYAELHKLSTQMAARELRYEFFDEVCTTHGYEKVATAHHQNDGMETLLLNLIRGTGLAGLHGIKPKRDTIIRPMLCFSRSEIDEIVKQNNLSFVEDSSNSAAKYVRNKIRLKIIPEMKSINPSLEETFDQNIAYFSKLEDFVKEQIANYKKELFEETEGKIKISISKLQQIKNLEFVLSELLLPLGFNLTSVRDLINSLSKESGRIFLASDHELNLDREYLFIKPIAKDNQKATVFEYDQHSVTFGNKTFFKKELAIKDSSLIKDKNYCFTDGDKLIFPLTIRKWQLGDKFVPLGMKGQKKLSDFFINQKIPISEKSEVSVLVNGDGKIIWIAGLRMDDRFKITAETKKLTTFEFKYQ